MSKTKETYGCFFTQLANHLENNGSTRRIKNPKPQYYYDIPIFGGGIAIALTLVGKRHRIGVEICLRNPNHKEFFNKLYEDEDVRAGIEDELGLVLNLEEDLELEWFKYGRKKKSMKKASISYEAKFNPLDEADWQRQFTWFEETIAKFDKVFTPRLKEIVAELGLG